MSHLFLSSNLTSLFAHVREYGLLILAIPPVALIGIKIWLLAKAASHKGARKDWVLLRERDENGVPKLARANDDFEARDRRLRELGFQLQRPSL